MIADLLNNPTTIREHMSTTRIVLAFKGVGVDNFTIGFY